MSERPDEVPQPAAAGTGRQDVEDRQPDEHEQGEPPAEGRATAGVDDLGRAGEMADQPGRDRRQPDAQRDASDACRLADADEPVPQSPAPCYARRGLEQVPHAEELQDRKRGERREADEQRKQAERPFRPRGDRPCREPEPPGAVLSRGGGGFGCRNGGLVGFPDVGDRRGVCHAGDTRLLAGRFQIGRVTLGSHTPRPRPTGLCPLSEPAPAGDRAVGPAGRGGDLSSKRELDDCSALSGGRETPWCPVG